MSSRTARPAKPSFNWVSWLQFLGSAFGAVGFLSIGLSSLAYVVLQPILQPTASPEWDMLLTATAALWAGVLLLPSAALSLAHLFNKPVRRFKLDPRLAVLAFVVLPLAILTGGWLLESELHIALPPVHILAASLSVGGLVWISLRRLQLGGLRLTWGAFASGLTAAPFVAIVLELLVGFVLVVIGAVYVLSTPSLASQIPHIETAMSGIENGEQLLELLHDFFNDPFILGLLLLDLSLFTPLIEELFKPVALWILIWRRPITNAQGFAIGVLGGAGFALMENLFAGSVLDWASTTTVRLGATAFHIATAGLMGWAIARAKNEAKVLNVFLVYGFNIILHGLWNGIVVLQSFTPALLHGREVTAWLILLGIGTLCVYLLLLMNYRLRPPHNPPPQRKPTAKP